MYRKQPSEMKCTVKGELVECVCVYLTQVRNLRYIRIMIQ